jgi:transcriptional regulator with XRE-family HTH domain
MESEKVTMLGVVLRQMREERGWTQAYLATVAGCDPSVVCRLEKGNQRTLQEENLAAFAQVFEVDPLIFRELGTRPAIELPKQVRDLMRQTGLIHSSPAEGSATKGQRPLDFLNITGDKLLQTTDSRERRLAYSLIRETVDAQIKELLVQGKQIADAGLADEKDQEVIKTLRSLQDHLHTITAALETHLFDKETQ